jgi:hypothetical protein
LGPHLVDSIRPNAVYAGHSPQPQARLQVVRADMNFGISRTLAVVVSCSANIAKTTHGPWRGYAENAPGSTPRQAVSMLRAERLRALQQVVSVSVSQDCCTFAATAERKKRLLKATVPSTNTATQVLWVASPSRPGRKEAIVSDIPQQDDRAYRAFRRKYMKAGGVKALKGKPD